MNLSSGTRRIAVITGGEGELAGALASELESLEYHVLRPGRETLDVRSPEQISDYFVGLPRLDLLINNAGCRHDGLIAKMEENEWENVISTNLDGAFRCSRAAFSRMSEAGGGHILNIGSHSAITGPAGQANYSASKAGLIGLTQSLAKEFGPHNIRVNCVLPGWLETKFSADVSLAAREAALASHVLGRFNTVSEAARAMAFLDTLPHLSGQVISLDNRIIPVL